MGEWRGGRGFFGMWREEGEGVRERIRERKRERVCVCERGRKKEIIEFSREN